MSAPVLVGTAEHYAQFIKLCRARTEELKITYDSLDVLCDFSERYTAKLLSGTKVMSVYSLFTLARALALLPSFHHDEPQLAQLRKRDDWITFQGAGARFRRNRRRKPSSGARYFQNSVEFYKKIGRLGAKRKHSRAKNFRDWGRKGAMKRWGGK